MKDALGRKLSIGDWVAQVGSYRGGGVYINKKIVTGFTKCKVRVGDEEGDMGTCVNSNRCILLECS